MRRANSAAKRSLVPTWWPIHTTIISSRRSAKVSYPGQFMSSKPYRWTNSAYRALVCQPYRS